MERSNSRYLDVVKEDMQEVGAREDEVFARNVCGKSAVGTPDGKAEGRFLNKHVHIVII